METTQKLGYLTDMDYGEFCLDLAKKAGEIFMHYFHSDKGITYKEGRQVVTKADTEINQLVIDTIRTTFPTHGVLGEEKDGELENARFTWITDPIDGTAQFARSIPSSVFSLALLDNGVPIVGAVYQPNTDTFFYGETGKGSYRNGIKMSVSTSKALVVDDPLDPNAREGGFSILSSIEPDDPFPVKPAYDFLFANGLMRSDFGSSTLMGCYVAMGATEAFIFPSDKPYDMAAVKVLVEEAGGMESNLFGEQHSFLHKVNGNVVTNGHVHAALLKVLEDTCTIPRLHDNKIG